MKHTFLICIKPLKAYSILLYTITLIFVKCLQIFIFFAKVLYCAEFVLLLFKTGSLCFRLISAKIEQQQLSFKFSLQLTRQQKIKKKKMLQQYFYIQYEVQGPEKRKKKLGQISSESITRTFFKKLFLKFKSYYLCCTL